MIDAPAPHDAAHLRDLAAVARGETTAASRAALFLYGQELWMAYVYGDIDSETYLDALDELMTAVELLPDTGQND